jgi:hypothetical protein
MLDDEQAAPRVPDGRRERRLARRRQRAELAELHAQLEEALTRMKLELEAVCRRLGTARREPD